MRVRRPAYVLLNPGAGGGRGRARWEQVQGALDRGLDIQRVYELPAAEEGWGEEYRRMLADRIRIAFSRGRRFFLAAGGDGTVQLLAGAMLDALDPEQREEAMLGAVGLGSSNDFHRPWTAAWTWEGCPLRLDFGRAASRDLGEVRCEGRAGDTRTCHFVVSASLGVVCLGNRLFNDAEGLVRSLKSFWTAGAIAAAALQALVRFRPVQVAVSLDGGEVRSESLTHLGVMKSPYLAGGLHYDFQVPENDGLLAVAKVGPIGLARRFYTMAALSRGRFRGLKGTHHRRTSSLEVRSEEPILLELDGETLEGVRFSFRVLPGALKVCAPGPPPAR